MDNKTLVIKIIILVIYIIYLHSSSSTSWTSKIKKIINQWRYPVTKLQINSPMNHMKEQQKVIDSYIKNELYKDLKKGDMRDLCYYTLEGGKRVRSIILLSCFKQLSDNQGIIHKTLPPYVIDLVLCIEYIHCASLIIDDIMDDDDERRGKECLHVKYNATTAQLVAIQLVSMAFKRLCSSFKGLQKHYPDANKNIVLIICSLLSDNMNNLSMGQYLDISITEDIKLPEDINKTGDMIKNAHKYTKYNVDIEDLIHKKTSSLFEISYILAWLLANCEKNDQEINEGIRKNRELARKFGLIFQISDDFEDVEQDLRRDGKNSIMNYVINKGLNNANKKYKTLVQEYLDLAKKYGVHSVEMQEIIDYLNKRVDVYTNYHKQNKII